MASKIESGDIDPIGENADINITPFIDVILVLLIIFMVAAPLSTVDVPVELPTSNAAAKPRPDKPVFVSLKSDLSLVLGDAVVARNTLSEALTAATKGNKDERIFLRGDKGVPYGEVVKVMNDLRSAGYLKIGLVGLEDVGAKATP